MRVCIFDRMEECTEEAVQAMMPQVSQQRREQALRYLFEIVVDAECNAYWRDGVFV